MKKPDPKTRSFKGSAFQKSALIHSLLIGILLLPNFSPKVKPAVDLQFLVKTKKDTSPASNLKIAKLHPRPHSVAPIDLRPSYLREGTLFSKTLAPQSGARGNSDGNETKAILNRPLIVIDAFDHLAAQINRNLEYPTLFVKNGIQGSATLTLRFDSDGNVNETQSEFAGSHHSIRGLLVKAARLGLVEWYQSDAYRLHKDQFKNQYFRAELFLSYVEADLSRLAKNSSGSYQITKRRYKDTTCGGDLICLAMKAEGAIENVLNDNERIRLDLLKDKLDSYDDQGLKGINLVIHEG